MLWGKYLRMTEDEALAKFGIVPALSQLEEIRRELVAETAFRRADGYFGEDDDAPEYTPVLYLFCLRLFAARQPEDCLLIWRAKGCDFDAFCMADSQFLCGAGLEETRAFLREQDSEEARAILEYISGPAESGWTHEGHIDNYRSYYGLA